MKKNYLIIAPLVMLFLALIVGCSTESKQEFKVARSCNNLGTICSIELEQVDQTTQKTLLGKEIVIKETVGSISTTDITWHGINTYATNVELDTLTNCAAATCTDTENPTGAVFTSGENVTLSVTGTVVVNGQTISLSNVKILDEDWVVPEGESYITEVTFSCPDNSVAYTSQTAPGAGGPIAIVTNASTSSCSMTFSCPTGYGMPSEAATLVSGSNGTDWNAEQLPGTGTGSRLLYTNKGNTTQTKAGIERNNGIAYMNGGGSGEGLKAGVTCYPIT